MKFSPVFLASAVAAADSLLLGHADTYIEKGVKTTVDYQVATLYMGMQSAYELHHDPKLYDWLKNQIDGAVQPDGTIKGWLAKVYSLDNYRIGNQFLYWYNQTSDEKYKIAAQTLRTHINTHPRNPSGGFWHHDKTFENQMWLDGLFMGQPFYARWTQLFDSHNRTAWNDILHQFTLIDTHARDYDSGLLVHGWAQPTDKAPWADPVTGRAPHVWGRADGWYFMALMEVIEHFPAWHHGRERLLHYFRWLAQALKENQDETGGWFQVMDQPYPEREGNYIEASGSAMFTYGLLKGIRLGYLKRSEFLGTAKKAYKGLVNLFVDESDGHVNYKGTVAECGLSQKNVTYEVSIPAHTLVSFHTDIR